jgi:hypothetical protein
MGTRERGDGVQGRSGSVAFPRTKVVPASPARVLALGTAARSAERTAVVRRSVEFMIAIGVESIECDGCFVDEKLFAYRVEVGALGSFVIVIVRAPSCQQLPLGLSV